MIKKDFETNNLESLLSFVFKDCNVYFYTIDNLFNKIVIFLGSYILEVSTKDRGCNIKKSNILFFYFRKFNDISKIYSFVNKKNIIVNNKDISLIITNILKYEKIIYSLFIKQNKIFFNNTFTKIDTNKKVLFILKGGGMEETIEKSFISYCNNSNINLTVLYRFGKGYWGQQLNQDGFFNELKINNKNVSFIYKEDYDDNYIDGIIDNYDEIFNFQYDYKGKKKNLNMIVLSSVTDYGIDCSMYKNIFSCYESKTIGYSTDDFFNTENINVYKIFNPQNLDLLNNYSVLNYTDKFILSGGMEWCRDFTILNSLKGIYKGILVSDEVFDINNFLCMYRGIQSYHGFFGTYILSDFFIACHVDEFNDDDRSKMIATSICVGKPVVIPYNEGEIVKTVLENKLGVTYKNGDMEDLVNKIRFFAENSDNVIEYGNRCKKYSEEKMDINKFINLIFEKSFK